MNNIYEDLINIMFKNPIPISEEDFDMKYDDILQMLFNKRQRNNEKVYSTIKKTKNS